MKKIITSLFLFLITCCASAISIPASPSNYVNDYAQILTPNTVQTLNQQLQQFEQTTTNQIVVATFQSLDGESIEDFATRLEEQWKIGQKEKDNGVLIVISKQDRAIRIEVGYGLESVIPDAMAGNIIQQQIVPYFKKGDYDAGVTQGVYALMKAIQPNAVPSSAHSKKIKAANQPSLSIVGIILIIAFLISGGLLASLFIVLVFYGIVGLTHFIPLWLGFLAIYAVAYFFIPDKYKYLKRSNFFKYLLFGLGKNRAQNGGKGGFGGFWRGGGGGGFRGGGGMSGGGGASGRW